MLIKKRAFVSIGASIVIFLIGSFLLLLTYKLLNSPPWMSTVLVWILAWPLLLAARLFSIPSPGRVGVVMLGLSMGVAADIAILSGIIYLGLSPFWKKSPSPPPPPPPFPFK